MRSSALRLFAGLLIVLIPEVLRVYLILPLPGSQIYNTVGVAYFLHCYINVFRVIGLLLMLPAAWQLWRHGSVLRKIVVAATLLLYGAVFYVFNFVTRVDKMFLQPKHIIFSSAAENKIETRNVVIGVQLNGEAKAYPINIIGYHHQIPDTIGGMPVVVTYCTVCRSGRAFSPVINGHLENFRLVGMDHYNALFEDATTGSWWRQENGQAVAGKMKGQYMKEIPSQQMTLKEWIRENPQTKVLQPDPVFQKDYGSLVGYDYGQLNNELEYTDQDRWAMKSWVVGVAQGKDAKAFDWNELKRDKIINDTLGDTPLLLTLAGDSMSFRCFSREVAGSTLYFIRDSSLLLTDTLTRSLWNLKGACVEGPMKGQTLSALPAYLEYWHAWKQFHPNSTQRLVP